MKNCVLLVLILTLLCSCEKKEDVPLVIRPTYNTLEKFGFTLKYTVSDSKSYEDFYQKTDSLFNYLDKVRDYIPYEILQDLQLKPIYISRIVNSEPIIYWYNDNFSLLESEQAYKLGSFEIFDLDLLFDKLERNEPALIFRCFSIPVYLTITNLQSELLTQAFTQLAGTNLYNNIEYINYKGDTVIANSDATLGELDYFLELSEAYFWNNNSYPFTYEDLVVYDQAGFNLMKLIWGKRYIKQFTDYYIDGFNFKINRLGMSAEHLDSILTTLGVQAKQLRDSLPPHALEVMEERPVWITYVPPSGTGTACFHPSKEWLLNNDFPPQMTACVHICDTRKYLLYHSHVNTLLHEMSHYYHFHVLGFSNTEIITTYNSVRASGIYYPTIEHTSSVGIVCQQTAYCMTNEKEYFAECSEAYWGKNDFYPYNREEFLEFDPQGYYLVKSMWTRE